MSNNTPKIIMVGKGYKNSGKDIKDILATVDPTNIPGDMLDSINVLLNDASKYKIDGRHLREGLNYSNFEAQLSRFGITKDVDQIEIVIDLELADMYITNRVDQIFSSCF